ncbi:MAG: hypothetical protein PWR20_616 [Bacteroidales bacterium]|jgi:hypothetical protein|nr:hypothetical protein [Bacteroidales bacterium]MDN5328840.1 hypothetical protein [Bacteroidales bacterium]
MKQRTLLLILLSLIGLAGCQTESDKEVKRITLQSDSLMMVADSTPFFIGKNLYLVIMEYPVPKPHFTLSQELGFLENRLIPGFQHIDSLRRTGIPIFGGAMALKPGCAFIIQATDNVHLQQMLRTNPLTEYSQVTIIPLVSFGESLFRQKDREAELKNKMNQ